ncbi:Spore germination protein KA [Bacillus thuringiensis serovar israelensis ATCC 35646]|nr:Spore germination protein KA [Bacillus thuringiensis serovar israelensis ATCC 35646]
MVLNKHNVSLFCSLILSLFFIKYISFFRNLNPSRVYKLGDKNVEHNYFLSSRLESLCTSFYLVFNSVYYLKSFSLGSYVRERVGRMSWWKSRDKQVKKIIFKVKRNKSINLLKMQSFISQMILPLT